jgi:hypothetical protein
MAQNFYSFLVDNEIVNIRRRDNGEWYVSMTRPATTAEKATFAAQAVNGSNHIAVHK